ncbi:hypothetical protein AVEN_58183-1 [Araneus ventricosus]|uniref:BACK domain-containing protein n=1 Tax=Araneus ventricosus TaxID=182803 RepID=A0A4Y2SDG6_ARAVE|nr:hypothetical protein AVEN_58183-1 [Araneus ventricosus]
MNFSKLLDQPTNEFADIPLQLFKTLLEDIVFLNIPDGTSLWRGVEQWVSNSSERLPAVRELLRTIRFRNLNTHLVHHLQKSDTLRKIPYMKEMNHILLTSNLLELSVNFENVHPPSISKEISLNQDSQRNCVSLPRLPPRRQTSLCNIK